MPGSGDPPQEIRCAHENSEQQSFTLRADAGALVVSLDQGTLARIPGGLPALEACLGACATGEGDGRPWSLQVGQPAQAEALVQLLFDAQNPPAASFRSRHWRVNITRAGSAQIDGGYLWASKKPAARAGQPVRPGITRMLPGDVVFARASSRLIAIGIALERARSSPDPSLTSTDGWLVPMRFEKLPDAGTVLPVPAASRVRHRSPARTDAQLAEMADSEAQAIRRSLARQVETFEERVMWETDGTLIDQAIEEQIWLRTDIAPAHKQQLSAARQGKGLFRDNVERLEHSCRVTGVLDRRYLRAVHMKPWREATDAERLDGANGLLLSPHLLQLFARGHISFADDGTLLISRHLNPYVRKAWILQPSPTPRAFRAQQRVFLEYHRTRLFERIEGGRRAPDLRELS